MQVLLHIGIGKAASTTLQDWFERHPDVWRFSEKGLIKGAAANKKVCVLSDERLSIGLEFDATTGLIAKANRVKEYQKSRCEELRALFPGAYVLIVTRGYAQFLDSFYAQYVTKGGILSFQGFLEIYGQAMADLLDYNYLVGTYQEAFGDRVIAVPMELLKCDARRFYGAIEDRLGLASEMRASGRRLNSRTHARSVRALPQLSRMFFRLLGPLSPAARRSMHKAYVRYVARGRLGTCLVRLMPERFLEDVIDSDCFVSRFHGLADVLAKSELYSEFRADYMLEENSIGACGIIKD